MNPISKLLSGFENRSHQKTRNRKKMDPADKRLYLIAFMLPVLAMICIFAGNEIWPFGDRSFLRTDLYHQYAPFMAELSRKMKHGSSLYYTWDVGGGTNFIALIGYYLSSFSNLLLLIVPQGLVIDYLSYMVIIKMGLAGLTFAILLRSRTDHADMLIPAVSTFYAMSGYVAAYSWNIMWMDCIWLTPLILLGIEKVVFEGRWLLYTISLGLAILSNYYIAIMLCMFCVLYFLIQLPDLYVRSKSKEDLEGRTEMLAIFLGAGLRFALASLLAGGLAGVILIPEVRAVGLTAAHELSPPTSWNNYFGILEMLGRHLADVAIENGLDHWPNIYCGIAVLICLPLYYMNKNVRMNTKVSKTILAMFMLFSFSYNIPNYIWHGFHYPNSLPCRQSFLYIALLLIMCYEGLKDLEEINTRKVGMAFAFAVAFIILCQNTMTDDAFEPETYWINLLFTGIYLIIVMIALTQRSWKTVMCCILLTAVTVEGGVNMAMTSITTVSRSEYLNYSDSYKELVDQLQELDPDFYRFEKVSRKTKNDGAFVGYPSVSTFSSVSYADVAEFYEKMGCEHSLNAYGNNGITPLMNSILGVKYILTTVTQQESQLMQLCDQNEDCYVYENLYTMKAGFMLPENFCADFENMHSKPVTVQNSFSDLAGGDTLFYEIFGVSNDGSEVSFTVDETCHVFVQVNDADVKDIEASVDGETKSFSRCERKYLLDLGYCEPGQEILIYGTEDNEGEAPNVTPYYLDEQNFINLITKLKEQEMSVLRWTDTSLEGSITASEDGTLFLSIPYDPGWTLYVDGEKTAYESLDKAYITCGLTAGTHNIRLTYRPQGLIPGILLTILSIALICLLYQVEKRRK